MRGFDLHAAGKGKYGILLHSAVLFLLTLALCLSMVFVMILNRADVERLTMEQLILEKSIKINDVISKLLYKTQMLSSLVLQGNGEVRDFERIAAVIVDDPAILNILIAPSGVVSEVYPLEGNEAVIGLDFFSEGAGNKEAVLAKTTGKLVLGGPFNAVQGSRVLVGRLPVYIHGADGVREFWGLVSVTLKYPDAMEGAGLNGLGMQGFAYEIWRINPDDNERQIIASSGHRYNPRTKYLDKPITILNAEWYFRILPIHAWYEFPETWISVLISIGIGLLVAVITQNNHTLKAMRGELDALPNTDSLTEISSRRYFMDSASVLMDEVTRANGESFVIMFDMDHFRIINDICEYSGGDAVLKETALRVSNMLRGGDLFARYGEEEFIIFVADMDRCAVLRLAERIRQAIAEQPFLSGDGSVAVTASFGVAPAAPINSLKTALALADAALSKAKKEGRNRVVIHE